MILRKITGFFRFCRHFRYHEAMGKGKEQFTPLDSYIMLDLETTGLKPDESEILEIGMIKVIDRKAVATFQAFVKPEGPHSAVHHKSDRHHPGDDSGCRTGRTGAVLGGAVHGGSAGPGLQRRV